jgi:hypothetical protein
MYSIMLAQPLIALAGLRLGALSVQDFNVMNQLTSAVLLECKQTTNKLLGRVASISRFVSWRAG